MLLRLGLNAHLAADHIDDLLTDDSVVQVKALKGGNQLARGGDLAGLIGEGECVLFISIRHVEALELLNFLEKSNGLDLSGTQEGWMSKLGLGGFCATDQLS